MATSSKFGVGPKLQEILNTERAQKMLHSHLQDKCVDWCETRDYNFWWTNPDQYKLVSRPGLEPYFEHSQDYVIGGLIDENGHIYIRYKRYTNRVMSVGVCNDGQEDYSFLPNHGGNEMLQTAVQDGKHILCRHEHGCYQSVAIYREKMGKWLSNRGVTADKIDLAYQYAWDFAAGIDHTEWELTVVSAEDLRYAYKEEAGDYSCMTHRTHLLDLYVENPCQVKLALLGNGHARSLLWFFKDQYIFVDRVYTSDDHISASGVVALVKKRYPTYDVRRTTDPPNVRTVLELTCSNELLPYSDSYSFTRDGSTVWVDPTGREGQNQHCENGGGSECYSCGDRIREADDTMINGEWYCDHCIRENFAWVEACDEYIDRDSACWIEHGQCFVHQDDARLIEWGDNDGDCVENNDVSYSVTVDGTHCVICDSVDGSTAEDFASWIDGKNLKSA